MFFRKATDLFYSQQHVTAETLTKSGFEFKNQCTQEAVNGEILASILKSGHEIKNRCRKQHIPQHASITR